MPRQRLGARPTSTPSSATATSPSCTRLRAESPTATRRTSSDHGPCSWSTRCSPARDRGRRRRWSPVRRRRGRRDRAAAGPSSTSTRSCCVACAAGPAWPLAAYSPAPALGRGHVRAGAGPALTGDDQLGPVRRRADRRLGMLAWARADPCWPGVLLGLAAATKFYPLVPAGPAAPAVPAGRPDAGRSGGRSAGARGRLAGGQPAGDAGWLRRAGRSSTAQPGPRRATSARSGCHRSAGGHPVPRPAQRCSPAGCSLLLCVGIAVLALTAPRRPRFAQLAFLVVAAFIADQQGLLAAVRALADPAGRAGPAALARLPDLAGLPRSCTSSGSGCTSRITYAAPGTRLPEWTHNGRDLSCGSRCSGTSARSVVRDILLPEHDPCVRTGRTTRRAACWTGRRTSSVLRRRRPAASDADPVGARRGAGRPDRSDRGRVIAQPGCDVPR